jgi:methylamine---glutamate N-methyltransferase subunit B
MAAIDCEGKTTRDINRAIKQAIDAGVANIIVRNPAARHNLGVGLVQPVTLTIEGSVGYYCGGMIDTPTIHIKGTAGWGLAESMLNGTVIVEANAGNGVGASIRGGTIVIHGDAAARAGVSIKGGVLLVGGNCGYMAGFMGQKGTIIVCGDTGAAFGDSMYETVCYVGGTIAELGNDAVVADITDDDYAVLVTAIRDNLPQKFGEPGFDARKFKKIVAGRKLWNFDKSHWKAWREVL